MISRFFLVRDNLFYLRLLFLILAFFSFFFQVGDYSVSLKAPGRNKHFRVHVEGTLFCIGQRKFPTLQQLVEHYQRAPIYTSQKGEKLFLIRPLPKWVNWVTRITQMKNGLTRIMPKCRAAGNRFVHFFGTYLFFQLFISNNVVMS